MDTKRSKKNLPPLLWKYLTQPLFSPSFKSLNPFRFWYLYKIEQFERLWDRSDGQEQQDILSISFLEDCWLKGWVHGVQKSNYSDSNSIRFLEDCWAREAIEAEPFFDQSEEYQSEKHCDESEEFY